MCVLVPLHEAVRDRERLERGGISIHRIFGVLQANERAVFVHTRVSFVLVVFADHRLGLWCLVYVSKGADDPIVFAWVCRRYKCNLGLTFRSTNRPRPIDRSKFFVAWAWAPFLFRSYSCWTPIAFFRKRSDRTFGYTRNHRCRVRCVFFACCRENDGQWCSVLL